MNYLLDTCVVSELVSKQPNQRVVAWVDGQEAHTLFLSVVTIGEVRKGIEKLPDSQRKHDLGVWLRNDLLLRFDGRIALIDVDVMLRWGELTGNLERAGKKMAAIDSLIAAVALHTGLTLVTRNEDDFKYAGLRLLNPWLEVTSG